MERDQKVKRTAVCIEFRTTVIKDNVSEIDELEKRIQREFGREFVLTQTRTVMHSVRGACTDVETCRLSPEENIKLFFRREFSKMKELVGPEFDPRKAKFTVDKKDAETINKQRLTLFYCNAGMRSYTITYNGKLLGCQMIECFYTEPFKEGFKSAWERFPSVVSVPKLPGKCIECTDRDFCSTCFAMRYAETGQLDGIPEYACADAKIFRQYYKEEEGYEEV